MTRALFVLLFVMLSTRLAFAGDEADKARATGLFAEAQALAQAGKLADACPKFEESVKAHAGVGNQFNLADCWEKIGRVASAHALFVKVAAVTKELGQTEREQAALARAAALLPKVTRLRIEVSSPNTDVELTRDGTVVEKGDWGKSLPVDPGAHELRATAPGKEPWSQKLEVPSEPGTVLVTVPVLADEKKRPAAVVAPVRPPPKKPAKKRAPDPATEESGGGFRQIATLSLVGIGAAGIITGGAMSAQYVGSHQDAQAVCPESVRCTRDQIALHDQLVDDARVARTWAFVGFGAGAAALAGAALLHFSAPSTKERPATAWLGAQVFVSPEGSLGGAVRGGF